MALAGCTKVSFGLDIAPRFITESLDDYFDMDSKSKSQMRGVIQKEIKKLYECCFKSAFAELEKEITSLKGDAPPELVQKVIGIYDKNKPAVMDQVKPDIETFINGLSDTQLKYFEREMADNIRKDEKEIKERDGNWHKSVDRFGKNFAFFCVGLENGEVKKSEEFLSDNQFPYEARLKVKKDMLAQVTAARVEKKKELLMEYSMGQGFDRAAYSAAAQKYRKDLIGFVFYIYNGLSEERQAKCRENFKNKVEEFRVYFEETKK